MKVQRAVVVAMLLACCSFAVAQTTSSRDAAMVPVLMLSDLHFDPLHDPAKASRLAAANVDQWDAILNDAPSEHQAEEFAAVQSACKARGVDTDFALLNASLIGAQRQAKGLGYVTVTGDLLVHGFDCRYRFAMHSDEGYAAFAEKTAIYVMHRVEAVFPTVPVYIALGNNDSSCGDYKMGEHDRFLHATSGAIVAGLRGASEAEVKQAREDYETNGYFGVTLKTPRRTRLLAIDDIYLSTKYAECSGDKDSAAADAALAWLDRELTAAKERGEKVWVIGHIPPGVDVYSTVMSKAGKLGKDVCGGADVKMFLANDRLADTLVKHADVVRLALFAHTHSDELRLLKAEDGAGGRVPLKMVASISPVNGNRPTFTLAQVDASSAGLKDYTVYEASNATGVDTTWSREYSFDEMYHVAEFSTATLAELIDQFHADPDSEKPASRAYEVNFTPGMFPVLALAWPQYACALEHATAAGYKACTCGTK
jgi:sphingomyelin phosphodiesterase acid-like 3